MTALRHLIPLLLVAGPAAAAEATGAARLWLGGGLDTNVYRDFVKQGDRVYTDAVLQGLLELDGALQFERGGLVAGYDVGGRKFLEQCPEDTLVQNGMLEGELNLLNSVSLGATLRARDRRTRGDHESPRCNPGLPEAAFGHDERTYTYLEGEGFLRFQAAGPVGRLDAKLHAGAHRFIYRTQFAYSFYGPSFGLNVRFKFNRRHSVSAFLDYEPRAFNAVARKNPDLVEDPPPDPEPPLPQRQDSFVWVGVGYVYRGPWALGLGYSYLDSSSNSYGETVRRHRLTLNAGVGLFWKLYVMGLVALQFVQYPDGINLPSGDPNLPSDILVRDDDESQNQVSLKLSRPLGDWFEVEFKWQLFFSFLAQNNLQYLRQTFTLGVAFRLGG